MNPSQIYDFSHGGLAPSNFVGGGEERGPEMPQPEELDEYPLTPYFLPDGSYVWMGSQLASGWQVQDFDQYPGPATIAQMTTPRSMVASSNAGFYDLMHSQAFQQPWAFEEDHTFEPECDTSDFLEPTQPHAGGSQDVAPPVRGTALKAKTSRRARAPYHRRDPAGASASSASSSSSSGAVTIPDDFPISAGGPKRLPHHCFFHPCTGNMFFIGAEALEQHLGKEKATAVSASPEEMAVYPSPEEMAAFASPEDMAVFAPPAEMAAYVAAFPAEMEESVSSEGTSASASVPEAKDVRVKCEWAGCDKMFRPASILRHVLTHLNVKFKCPHHACTFKSTRQAVTKAHMLKKHGEACIMIDGVEAHDEVPKY
ncbi:hypothetical protein BDZ97DRAFT_2044501 [Flammula alnicola]|nr:hypothetical protein BDZ97DRAFT_2044501 [Flammula alnicola]